MSDVSRKSTKGIIIGLLVIIILFIGVLLGLFFGSFNKKELKDAVIENDKTEEKWDDNTENGTVDKKQEEDVENGKVEDKEVEISLTDSFVENLIRIGTIPQSYYSFSGYRPSDKLYNTYLPDEDGYFALFYKKPILYAKNIPDEVKMLMTVLNTDYENENIGSEGCEYFVSDEILKSSFQKIFGSNVEYRRVEYGTTWMPALYESDNRLVIGTCGGDTTGPSYQIESKMFKATKTADAFYLYEAVALADRYNDGNGLDDNSKADYYNDVYKTKLVASGLTEIELFEKYLNSLSQYRYTFRLDNGSYYFEKIERIQ